MDTILMIVIGVAGIWFLSKLLGLGNSSSSSDNDKDMIIPKETEDDEDLEECVNCKKKISEDEDVFECEDCGENTICEKCMVTNFQNVNICKKCVDKAYPRKAGETKIEYIEKIIEKPVYIGKYSSEDKPKKIAFKTSVEPIFEDSKEFD